jgi:hypothetical protein
MALAVLSLTWPQCVVGAIVAVRHMKVSSQAIKMLRSMLEQVLVYSLTRIIYNLFLSPLAKIPGPKYAAISNVWYCYHW